MNSDSNRTRRIVVIGGGVSGLAAAHRLHELNSEDERCGARAPLEVLLLEASSRLGGTIRTHHREGFLLEGGPDSFITEKPAARALAVRLGLGERLIETNAEHRRSFVVSGGRLHSTPEGFQLLAPSRMLPFLTTGIFTWRGKARMALDLLLPRRSGSEDDESLADFVRRRFGREALERMAQPMVGGIYTADPELLSLRATMPRFLEMEREHRSLILAMRRAARSRGESTRAASGARYNLFLSFDDGMRTLTDALAKRLPHGSVRLDTRAVALNYEGSAKRWTVTTDAGERFDADGVCIALPAHASARLLSSIDEELSRELASIPYASTATVNLAYRREDITHPLDGFGFVVPFIERRTTLACTFSSVKFKGRAPEGYALLRAFVGGALQPEAFEFDERVMVDAVRRDLAELLGATARPLFSHVEKWPRSMAQYHIGHTARVERISERLRAHTSLRLCGNAFTGAGIPDCVREGERAASELLSTLLASHLEMNHV